MDTIRIAAVQTDPKLGDRSGNLARMLDRLAEAADRGARLVAFPECALSGYCFGSRAEALEQAEPIPGPSVDRLASACGERGISAIIGMLERDGDRLFNASALVGPGGVVASYRKVHLPHLGVDRFTDPGDRPFGVVEVEGLRVGMHICYDGAFPETGRIMSLMGADLLALPTNWPIRTEVPAEHLTIMRAYENHVFCMAVNRVGTERGFRFIGRSSIADPHGVVLARTSSDLEEVIVAEIDPALARDKRLVRVPGEHEINLIADRRPAFYGRLVERNGGS
jgi:predicted amidohydrolase